jgi:hypothetical protein
MSVDCPHCGKSTDLLLAPLPEVPLVPRRTIVWTVVTVLVLLSGLAAALVALKGVERQAAARRQPAKPGPSTVGSDPQNAPTPGQPEAAIQAGYSASEVILEKLPGSGLICAVGTLTNTSARQRFAVKVTLDLFDTDGRKVGAATDYQQVIEPSGQWRFKALVVEKKTVAAKIATVQEER